MDVVISGAGLVGLASALYLAKLGHTITIYEMHSREWFEQQGYTKGKKLFIDLSVRGLSVLDDLKVLDKICLKSIKLKGRIIHTESKQYQLDYSYDANDFFIVTTDRKNIMNALVDAVNENPNITIQFNSKIIRLNVNDNKSIHAIVEKDDQSTFAVDAQLLLGCDGKYSYINSYVHKQLGSIQNKSAHYYQYIELDIDDKIKLDTSYMHIWPSKDCFIAAQPNYDNTFSANLVFPNTASENINNLIKSGKLDDYLKNNFSHIYASLKITHAHDFYGGVMEMITPSYINLDNILLLGDSSHVMPPFLGQGVNSGFEDAQKFYLELTRSDSLEEAIFNYSQNRFYDHEAICRLSRDAYFHLALPVDKWHEDIDQALKLLLLNQELLSERQDEYKSYHNYVCFTKMSYKVIYCIKRVQLELLHNILNSPNMRAELLKKYKIKCDKIMQLFSVDNNDKELTKISHYFSD